MASGNHDAAQTASEHHLTVPRTARFYAVGELDGAWSEVWYVLHGYAQLARNFARACNSLATEERLVVAPEGLSRFYVEGSGGTVAASWMTKEDRQAEIADTVAYLVALDERVRGGVHEGSHRRASCSILGFSQGAAAAARAVVLGGLRPARLVLWGSGFPPDLEPEASRESLSEVEVVFVVGRTDPFFDEERFDRERARLEAVAPHARVERFDGGHRLQRRLLRSLAGSGSEERGPARPTD